MRELPQKRDGQRRLEDSNLEERRALVTYEKGQRASTTAGHASTVECVSAQLWVCCNSNTGNRDYKDHGKHYVGHKHNRRSARAPTAIDDDSPKYLDHTSTTNVNTQPT